MIIDEDALYEHDARRRLLDRLGHPGAVRRKVICFLGSDSGPRLIEMAQMPADRVNGDRGSRPPEGNIL